MKGRWYTQKLTVLLAALTCVSSLLAQRDRDVGRTGGSRIEHETRQSEALQQNNDPRFASYRDLINDRLDKQVRQVVADYERTQKRNVQISPQQFIAVQIAAKETKINAETLTLSLAGAAQKQKNIQLLAQPSDGEFQQRLAGSIERLAGLAPDVARETAQNATNAVASAIRK
jgi:hypothetical protein